MCRPGVGGFAGDASSLVRRRLAVLGLLAGGLGLLAALDTVVAVGPAFGLSLAAATVFRL